VVGSINASRPATSSRSAGNRTAPHDV